MWILGWSIVFTLMLKHEASHLCSRTEGFGWFCDGILLTPLWGSSIVSSIVQQSFSSSNCSKLSAFSVHAVFFSPANHLVHIRTSPLRAWAPPLWQDGNKRLPQVCLKDSQGAVLREFGELKLLRGLISSICSRHKISLYPKRHFTLRCDCTKLLWLT